MTSDGYTLWPGSRAARGAGCICPVLDNGYGDVGLARDRGGWWQVTDCPVHGPEPAPVPRQRGSRPITDDHADDLIDGGWEVMRGER